MRDEAHQPRRTIRREVRKRGFFGWVFLLIFLGFNAVMLLWLIGYWTELGKLPAAMSEAERAGAVIGSTIGTGFIIMVWGFGAVILGLLALLTRGRRTIITEED